jgi:hypothetical protein
VGDLQKAQPEQQIDMERGRQWIALNEGLLDAASGLVQPRVVSRHADTAPLAERERPLEDRGEQPLRLPAAAGVQEVLRPPAPVLATIRPDDPL